MTFLSVMCCSCWYCCLCFACLYHSRQWQLASFFYLHIVGFHFNFSSILFLTFLCCYYCLHFSLTLLSLALATFTVFIFSFKYTCNSAVNKWSRNKEANNFWISTQIILDVCYVYAPTSGWDNVNVSVGLNCIMRWEKFLCVILTL